MTKRDDLTPSLFDEPEDDESDWEEVPQPVFLSWSKLRQFDYCWRRDLDAAVHADTEALQTFYLARAAAWKKDLDEAKSVTV